MRPRPVVLAVLFAALAAGGCAETKLAVHAAKVIAQGTTPDDGAGAYKVGQPYQVNGVWYHPTVDPDYDEIGLASWYGTAFHGKATANGATYDMNALTAAHKTLPMPSRVRVTNLENGRSILLTVNDRGPFVDGRIIDVSRRGAQLLGFYHKGTARVRVQAVPAALDEPLIAAPEAEPDSIDVVALAPPPEGAAFYVQAGAFADPGNAHALGTRLAAFGEVEVSPVTVGDAVLHRVRIGPLHSADEAATLLERVIAAGHSGAHLVAE